MFRVLTLSFALFCAAGSSLAQSHSTVAPSQKAADSGIAPKAGTRVTNLSGGVVDQQVTLNWETVNETGIREYVIEHAAANGGFEAIGSLPAKGSGKYAYRYRAAAGDAQARLRIIKTNGETKYSAPLRLKLTALAGILEASPNPATGPVQIQGLSFGDQALLLGATGQAVRSFTASRTTESLNLEGLPAGVYLLQVRSAEGEPRPGLRIVKR